MAFLGWFGRYTFALAVPPSNTGAVRQSNSQGVRPSNGVVSDPRCRTGTRSRAGAAAVAATVHVDEFQSGVRSVSAFVDYRLLGPVWGLRNPRTQTNAEERSRTQDANALRLQPMSRGFVSGLCAGGSNRGRSDDRRGGQVNRPKRSAHSTPNSGDLPTAARPRHLLQRQRPRQDRTDSPSDNPSQTRREWLPAPAGEGGRTALGCDAG